MNERPNDAAIAKADELHKELARGWNTWDTRSVLRHVLLPHGLAISLGFSANDKLVWLKDDVFFGRFAVKRSAGTQLTSLDKPLPHSDTIEVRPGPHAYDGAYTMLEVDLRGARFRVETAAKGDQWVALITPLQDEAWPRTLTVQASLLWNRPGYAVRADASKLRCHLPEKTIDVVVDGEAVVDANLPVASPYLAVQLDQPVAVSAGRQASIAEVTDAIAAAKAKLQASHATYREQQDAYAGMQSCLAWNVIYEPSFSRVLCTVARDWNVIRGGYAVFCWDSFFMAWMIHLDHPTLGYATLLEAFREMIDGQFVANIVQGSGRKSSDRSQPPVAAVALLAMRQKGLDASVLKSAWPALLAWNRWWDKARQNAKGTLSLGSNRFTPTIGDAAEFVQPATAAGAAIESGLDNAAIYDGATFDQETELMEAEDVGITALYIADCEALATLARSLGYSVESSELLARREKYVEAVGKLWSDDANTFLNRNTSDETFAAKQCLTSYYPLYAAAATTDQADRMVLQNLTSPRRYDGEWILPVSPRDDAAFDEQLYLRGRVWPPTNLLVYLGLRRYEQSELCQKLADRSEKLIVSNWKSEGVVAENYSAVDGTGGRGAHTHPLHGWGGLFALIALIEAGHAASPFDGLTIPKTKSVETSR